MAEQTPVKAANINKSEKANVCRCCNCSFANHPIDLFGAKAEKISLLSILRNLTSLTFCEGDGFPSIICRNCFSLLKRFSEFKVLCIKSRSDQESLIRLKRRKKVTESPSVVQQRVSKRGKPDVYDQVAIESSFSCRKGLQFPLIHPKEVTLSENESHKGRILPRSLWPVATPQPNAVGCQILAKSGLRNNKVCKGCMTV